MSRQFNAAIPTYNRLDREIRNKAKSQNREEKSNGLLSPRKDKVKLSMSEDINEPVTRVMEHMSAIRNYRTKQNA
jgi:hypothetical protein